MLFSCQYYFQVLEHTMRYEGSQRNNKPSLDRVLNIINYALVIIIALCFNYMIVNFLFW